MSNQNQNLYRAMQARDRRFDGKFFAGVRTTGIYCRPICPARTPHLKNITFYPTAAAAEAAGFRACFRCRPETAPGTPAWMGTAAPVTRALRLISGGLAEAEGIEKLADRVGLSDRQLRRLFLRYLGAPPQAIVQVRRLDFARRLLDETSLPISEIGLVAGFESIRRFNDAFKKRFLRSPRELRERGRVRTTPPGLRIHLPYRAPYDWEAMLEFVRGRAITGVEIADEHSYRRTVRLGESSGVVRVAQAPTRDGLVVDIDIDDNSKLLAIVDRLKTVFDTEADPEVILRHLGRDRALKPILKYRPGLRLPGAWDGFELAIRAIVGQQISVAGARTILGRIVERCGPAFANAELTKLFPPAAILAQANLDGLGITGARLTTIRTLAAQVAENRLHLDGLATLDEVRRGLAQIKGIGPWTIEYIAMRGLSDPDAFVATDLIVKRELQKLATARPETWSPWRAYATIHLWHHAGRKE